MVTDTSLRPGSVCTEVFQELMITFIAQPVQGALQGIAKGPTTGEACLQRLQDEEGIRANPFWRPAEGWDLELLEQRALQCKVVCGGDPSLLLARRSPVSEPQRYLESLLVRSLGPTSKCESEV